MARGTFISIWWGISSGLLRCREEEWEREKIMASSNCDMCVNYIYDEEYECYCCLVNLDEDEMYRFLSGTQHECPYFRLDDEYGVVRHQM